jgi:hypothetical protein
VVPSPHLERDFIPVARDDATRFIQQDGSRRKLDLKP